MNNITMIIKSSFVSVAPSQNVVNGPEKAWPRYTQSHPCKFTQTGDYSFSGKALMNKNQ